MSEPDIEQLTPRSPLVRIAAAIAVALAFSGGVYLLLEAVEPAGGLIAFSFLLMLPAAVSAFVAYVSDPLGERPRRFYLMVPVWILLAVIAISVLLLREGVICIILLAPLWLVSGMVGTAITYSMRHRPKDGTTYCSALLLAPLLAMQIEAQIPLPVADASVTRSITVDASPAQIWPLLLGIPDVRPDEGRWNLSQDVIGLPRPIGAHLVGTGLGAQRYADWGERIKFRERITGWQPGKALGWRFIFDDIEGWKFTDRHLMPNSPYFHITTGGYQMEPLGNGRTRVILDTRYTIQTPVNLYSQLWGELFLGDVENNLLGLVKGRAEAIARADLANQDPVR